MSLTHAQALAHVVRMGLYERRIVAAVREAVAEMARG